MTVCHDHCMSSCVLKLHVKDGIITRIETDDGPEPQYRACQKGRAYRQYVYAPGRLKFPLRRAGERGEGKFERISWDEALDTIATQLRRVKETYGADAIVLLCSGGDMTWLNNGALVERVLVGLGGYTGVLGTVSAEGTWFASMATYGSNEAWLGGRPSLGKSRLIILWGSNPAVSRLYGNVYYLAQLAKAGVKVVVVDPRYTETASLLAATWIPIRPGTDAAMLIAMAHVIIDENLHDQAFLEKYTVGFRQFKSYVLGEEDGIPKTPVWAECITGVPAATTVSLAREYAKTKPSVLVDGVAPGRTACGEQFNRAAATLAAMTGNIIIEERSGRHGVNSRIRLSPGPLVGLRINNDENPVHRAAPLRKGSVFYQRAPRSVEEIDGTLFYGGGPTTAYLNRVRLADAILEGRSGGYPADYKLLYMVTINWLNQYGNSNRIAQALKKLEFVVAQEQFMTPTAKFADIILPTNTILERNDVTTGFRLPFYGYMNKAIASLGESKSQFEIAAGLAQRLGISGFADKQEDEWLREVVQECKEIPNYDAFKKDGIHRVDLPKSFVPFATPSGKIEIFSQDLADMGNPMLPPVPEYVKTWEGPDDPLARKYPLQLISSHFFRRVHSKFEDVPWLKEMAPQAVSISGTDARSRGIKDGDLVRVFNDRGQMTIPARVTERIMPGVVDVPEGGTYNPDESGVDRGGCANVLTKDEPSPGGAFCSNTALVQIEKVA